MKCDRANFLLSVELDKALSSEEAAELRAHLETCATCRAEQQLLAASWEFLGELKPIEPSPTFRARFWERVRQEEAEAKSWWNVFVPSRLVPVAAGFLVIWTMGVAGGLFLFGNRPRQGSVLESAAMIFTSPLPPNSIEHVYLLGGKTHES